MSATFEPCSDETLRIMRNAIYGNARYPQTDESWNNCKKNWRRDEAWLRDQFNKEVQRNANE